MSLHSVSALRMHLGKQTRYMSHIHVHMLIEGFLTTPLSSYYTVTCLRSYKSIKTELSQESDVTPKHS